MNYMPAVESMNRLDGGPLGENHVAIFFDQVKSAGQIQYAYLLVVYDRVTEKPVYIVASEVNTMRDGLGGGSHFLGVFPGDGHLNLGDSDDWADADKFLHRAIGLAATHLGLKPADPDDTPVAGFTPGD
jgi:hypothetical protein